MKSRDASSLLVDAREVAVKLGGWGEGDGGGRQVRARASDASASTDIIEWGEANFYIAAGGKIQFSPHQKCLLRLAFTRNAVQRFPYTTIVYSTIKKSGKSTVAAVAARWFAETQTRYGEVYAIGNDAKQARDRSFAEIRKSFEQTPGYLAGPRVLPGRWRVLEGSFKCLATGSVIAALSLDARGEAGSAPALTIWTELWGFESAEARRFWDELTPVPTLPDSIRFVETYAGYEGESALLHSLWTRGLEGRQLTAHDLAMAGSLNATSTKPGETYEELLFAFAETDGEPEALVPVYADERSGLLMYWDEGTDARRMPWQVGELGDAYYRAQADSLGSPQAFSRLHENRWTSAESAFIPIELWDRCYDPSLPPLDTETPIVVSCDAAVSQDCFGVVAISRHPDRPDDPAIRAKRVWTPTPGHEVDFDEPEAFLRWLLDGGCALGHPRSADGRGHGFDTPKLDEARRSCEACAAGDMVPPHRVVQVCYDPYQLENMMQRLRRDGLGWIKKFLQGNDRLVADRQLYSVIAQRRLAHNEDPSEESQRAGRTPLRDHIRNANVQLQKKDDSKMRLIKKQQSLKIDLAVATSMGVARCLKIVMSNA